MFRKASRLGRLYLQMFRMISLLLLTVMGDAASSDDPIDEDDDSESWYFVSYDKKDQKAFTLIY